MNQILIDFEKLDKESEKNSRKHNFKRLMNKPLEFKIEYSKNKIREFLQKFPNATISFSGGKDSSVLLHLVRSISPNQIAVFSDTSLEYKEIYEIVKNTPNVIWKNPIKTQEQIFKDDGMPILSKELSNKIHTIRTQQKTKRYGGYLYGILTNNGYSLPKVCLPFLDKDWFPYKISDKCCHYLKVATCGSNVCLSEPSFIGTRAEESRNRFNRWVDHGCNVFDKGKAASKPLSIWTEKDIDQYIINNEVPIASIYTIKGGWATRTGCKTCPMGAHLEKRLKGKNRFERLYDAEPDYLKQYVDLPQVRLMLATLNIPIEQYNDYEQYRLNLQPKVKEWYTNLEANIEKIVDEYTSRVNLSEEELIATLQAMKDKYIKNRA